MNKQAMTILREKKKSLNSKLENDNKGVLGDVIERNISSCVSPSKKLFHVWHVIYELHIQHIMKAEVQKAKTERARKMSSCVHTTAVLCKKTLSKCFSFEAADY